MSNVIHFADVVQRRRVDATFAERDAATERAAAKRRAKLHQKMDSIGAGLSGHIIADAIANMAEARERERAADARRPAYCDPSNEARGSKYDATRDLPTKEIAKRIRADIKDAIRGGVLPAIKTSVRYRSFAGGSAIDVTVTALPEAFPMLSPKFASWCRQFPADRWCAPMSLQDQHSPERSSMMTRLKSICDAYNRDNSDSMTDYFDVRFYGSVSIDTDVARPLEETEIAAARPDYWADDANRR